MDHLLTSSSHDPASPSGVEPSCLEARETWDHRDSHNGLAVRLDSVSTSDLCGNAIGRKHAQQFLARIMGND